MRQIITPYLLYEDADSAVAFLTRAFGFRELDRSSGRAGGQHVEMEVSPGGARIYLGSPGGKLRGPATAGRTSIQYVLVDDVDAHHARAAAAGATIMEELVDMPCGDRRYGCRDPRGHEYGPSRRRSPAADRKARSPPSARPRA